MNKKQIQEKLLIEKDARLIDILEINHKKYAKAMIVLKQQGFNFEYKYYEISNDIINEITDSELENVRSFFEKDHGNIVY